MIEYPNMILLGAAGRNAGKTEFACRLIKKYSSIRAVIGVKITTIKETDGTCPRGGSGCGVCSSLKNNFCITEEFDRNSNKDTSRMHAAGASKVYWLRVKQDFLQEGVTELLAHLPKDAIVVCESNSLRQVLEPGVFIVIRDFKNTNIKETCESVIKYADRLVDFYGDNWSLSPDKCHFKENSWQIPLNLSVAVLAGGQSKRMGTDKSLLNYKGQALIQYISSRFDEIADEVIIGANDIAKYSFLNYPIIKDEISGAGPLAGISACLKAAKFEKVFITACDIPEIPYSFFKKLVKLADSADIVIPRTSEGNLEPLMGIYSKKLACDAEKILLTGGRRIIELFNIQNIKIEFLDFTPDTWYYNLNTQEDYEKVKNYDKL